MFEAALIFVVLAIAAAGVWFNWVVEDWSDQRRLAELEAEKERRYRAVDFGGVAAPRPQAPAAPGRAAAASPKPSPTLTPLTAQPAGSVLARAVADSQPRWARAGEQGALALGCVAVAVFTLALIGSQSDHSDDGAPEAVSELLELHGFAAPKLKRKWLTIRCRPNSMAYQWSAMGARGLACVHRYDGEIRVKIERSWGKLPTVAFERVAIRPVAEPQTVEALTPQEMLRPDDLTPSELIAPLPQ